MFVKPDRFIGAKTRLEGAWPRRSKITDTLILSNAVIWPVLIQGGSWQRSPCVPDEEFLRLANRVKLERAP